MKQVIQIGMALTVWTWAGSVLAEADYTRALRRSQYLLNGTVPSDTEIEKYGVKQSKYRSRVRDFLEDEKFYKNLLRYHERVYGTGLESDYIDELRTGNGDDKSNKFAKITCTRDTSDDRMRCRWASEESIDGTTATTKSGDCPVSYEEPASAFWYPGIIAWACPSVIRACGQDLSRCFIQSENQDDARNAELGTTELFDSRFAVLKSLSRQSAGLATRVATENYPYNLILKSGLSAIDGAVVHFYKQDHHFRIDDLHIPPAALALANKISLTDSKFVLLNTGPSYESAGILSTFGWLRRYAKNRTRGNEMYQRVLCRKFTSELPRVFPQDPGNLRETDGCKGCHATLDPLADFWKMWGEGGDLYQGQGKATASSFAGKDGKWVEDLGDIVAHDTAFATCTTMKVWEWLMGREFYFDEAELRGALADYFIDRKYNLKELIYAVASHPAFTESLRSDAAVTDPLAEPPLGTVPNTVERECAGGETYASDIDDNSATYCEACHNGTGGRVDLRAKSDWQQWGSQAVGLMGSGQMPPGVQGPEIIDFKEKARCWIEGGTP